MWLIFKISLNLLCEVRETFGILLLQVIVFQLILGIVVVVFGMLVILSGLIVIFGTAVWYSIGL